jgi:alkylation response protein AidB-like acyl-CoA dehydrogenase
VQGLARDFARGEIAPHAAEWNARHEIPRAVLEQLGEIGLMGIVIPEEHGGSGLDHTSLCLAVEEIAAADTGVSVALAVQNGLAAAPIVGHGTAEQKERFLPDLASARTIGAYALTEPEVGSDAARLRTRAERRADGGYTVDGAKQWITNGGIADVFVIFARTGGEGARGISAFVAGAGPGLVAGPEIEKLGLHSSSTVGLSLDGFGIAADGLLGAEGEGLRLALETLDGGRITIAAQACGIAQAALDLAVEYAGMREAFGGPIARFQGVQFPIAEIAARLDAARLLMLHAAALKDAGAPHGVVGAKAKLVASRVAVDAADVAVQTLGGYGYSAEYGAERLYRDAKITELYEGTSQIQRLVIARDLFGDAARG